jgi:hypothetical protein
MIRGGYLRVALPPIAFALAALLLAGASEARVEKRFASPTLVRNPAEWLSTEVANQGQVVKPTLAELFQLRRTKLSFTKVRRLATRRVAGGKSKTVTFYKVQTTQGTPWVAISERPAHFTYLLDPLPFPRGLAIMDMATLKTAPKKPGFILIAGLATNNVDVVQARNAQGRLVATVRPHRNTFLISGATSHGFVPAELVARDHAGQILTRQELPDYRPVLARFSKERVGPQLSSTHSSSK